MDDVHPYKDALLKKRTEILGTGGIKPLQASMENNTRQGDMADQASGNNEVHIQLKLKQTDAKILQAIEEALMRIDKGTYGICRDCGEPIAPARLASRWGGGRAPAAAGGVSGGPPRAARGSAAVGRRRVDQWATPRHAKWLRVPPGGVPGARRFCGRPPGAPPALPGGRADPP